MEYGPRWVLESTLARSSRPGYPNKDVDPGTVDQWLARVRGMGIKSVICLLDKKQLGYYRRIRGGLLEY